MSEEEKLSQVFWPSTTIPYGEETAFLAAKVYAQVLAEGQRNLVPYNRLNDLVLRAAELLITEDSPGHEGHRDKLIKQWLKDAGVEEK